MQYTNTSVTGTSAQYSYARLSQIPPPQREIYGGNRAGPCLPPRRHIRSVKGSNQRADYGKICELGALRDERAVGCLQLSNAGTRSISFALRVQVGD
jgi:hypothetical protein